MKGSQKSSQKVYKNFLFNKERDQDIFDWLDKQENQSEAVRRAIRALMAQEEAAASPITLEDVMERVEQISEQIAKIKVVSDTDEAADDEPQDVVMKLRNFGL